MSFIGGRKLRRLPEVLSAGSDDELYIVQDDVGSRISVGNLSVSAIDEGNIVTSDTVTEIVSLTQAEYDLITPDPETMYFITDAGSSHLVIKDANQSVNNTTLVPDTELTINLSAGLWSINGLLIADGSTTGDLKVAWNGPSDMGGKVSINGQTTAASSGGGTPSFSLFSRGVTASRGTIGPGTALCIFITGFVEVLTPGNFYIEWAQNATDAPNPTIIEKGSWIRVAQQ